MPPDREPNLENELRDLGLRIEYPPTPDLARSVKGRLEAEDGVPASRRGPSLWWLVAAALVVLAALPVLSIAIGGGMGGTGGMAGGAGGGEAGSGEQAADGPEVDNLQATSMQGAQAGGAGEAASALPSGVRLPPAGKGLGLGEKIPLREARRRSETPIFLPRSARLGEPDEVYDRDGSRVTFLYRDAPSGLPSLEGTRVGLLLTQTPGDVGAAYLPGGTVEMAGLEPVSVNGEQAYWVPASGEAPRVARSAGLLAGVLLWERGGKALRIETDVPKKEAVRIAESVR